MVWLSNWCRRKSHLINGSTHGAVNNYQKKVIVYKNGVPDNLYDFNQTDRWLVANGEWAQGIGVDDDYVYVTTNFVLRKFNKAGAIQVTKNNAHLEGTAMDQVNGICALDDIYLYVSSGKDSDKSGYIKVFLKSDLSYVEEHQVKSYFPEDVDFHDGYWWISYCWWDYISKYDTDWNWVADYQIPTDVISTGCTCSPFPAPQSGKWHGNRFYINIHECSNEDELVVLEWTGSGFVFIKRIEHGNRPTASCSQGIHEDPDLADTMWFAERVLGNPDAYAIKATWVEFDQNQFVSCEGNCQDNFGDIRFTQSDGSTPLDYWMIEKVDGLYAIFWVEVATIPADPNTQTIYIYYGTAGATVTTSNAGNTLLEFDDFEDDDWSNWTTKSANCTRDGTHVKTGVSACKSSGGLGYLWRDTLDYPDQALHLWIYVPNGFGNNAEAGGIFSRDEDNNTQAVCLSDSASTTYFTKRINGVYSAWTAIRQSVGWHELQLKINGGGAVAVIDDEYEIQLGVAGVRFLNYLYLGNVWGTMTADIWFDTFFRRNYVNPEPTHGSWGVEEGGSSPADPTNINAVCLSAISIQVTWIDNATNETAYYVERDDGGWHVVSGALPADTQTYTDAVLCGIAYLYRVRAYNGNCDLYSNYLTLGAPITCPCPPSPLAPSLGGEWRQPYDFQTEPSFKVKAPLIVHVEETKTIKGKISSFFEETLRTLCRKFADRFQETKPIIGTLFIKFTETCPIMAYTIKKFEETKPVIGIVFTWFVDKKRIYGETKSLEEDILEELKRMGGELK